MKEEKNLFIKLDCATLIGLQLENNFLCIIRPVDDSYSDPHGEYYFSVCFLQCGGMQNIFHC